MPARSAASHRIHDALVGHRPDPGARLVAIASPNLIDSRSMDDTRGGKRRPAHSTLLREEMLMMNPCGLVRSRGHEACHAAFDAVPPKVKSVGARSISGFHAGVLK